MLFFIKLHFYWENFSFFDNSLYFCKKLGRNLQKEGTFRSLWLRFSCK